MKAVVVDLTNVVPNLVVLIDLTDIRGYTDSQQTSLKSILRYCSTFRYIMAHSSGSGSFLPLHSKARRIFNEYKDNYPKVDYVPFDKIQAETFLRVTPPRSNVIPIDELKVLTGFNQSLMVAYVSAENIKQVMMSKVRSFFDSIVPTLRSDNLFWVNENLPICRKFFYYAINEIDIPICYMDEYIILCSWINIESITYLVEETPEKFKLGVNFPLIIPLFMTLFREFTSTNGFKSAIVDGLSFEDAICKKIDTLNIKYSKTGDNIEPVNFNIIAHSEFMTALKIIHPNILYHLRDFHPTIDAIGCFTDEEDVIWLVMIQVSLGTYNKHKSKAADLFNKTVGSEKTVDASCSLLDYYRNRIHGVTDPKEIKCMYVYISPKEFFSQTNPSEILGEPGIHSRTKDLYFGLVLEHSETGQFITKTYAAL